MELMSNTRQEVVRRYKPLLSQAYLVMDDACQDGLLLAAAVGSSFRHHYLRPARDPSISPVSKIAA